MAATQPLFRPGASERLPPPSASTSVHLMQDGRVRRGPAMSHSEPRAREDAQPAPAPARARAGGTLRSSETAGSYSAKLSLPAGSGLLTLHSSARLDVTARKRGPNPFDIRAGLPPREELDVGAFLEEAPPPGGARATREAGAQADEMLPPHPADPAAARLSSSAFAAKKSGVDAESQVEHGAPDWQSRPRYAEGRANARAPLFDFDSASAALNDGLAGAVLEQSLLEVEHEDALLALALRREAVQAALDADAKNEARLADEARARLQRRAALKAEAEAEYARALLAMEKVAAAQLARGVVSGDRVAAVALLRESGHFVDPAVAMVEAQVMPGLFDALAATMERRAEAAATVDSLISGAAAAAAAHQAAALEEERKARAEMEKNYFIRVFVRVPRRAEDVLKFGQLPPGTLALVDARTDVEPVEIIDSSGSDGDFRTVVVGPVKVRRIDAVKVVEANVHDWILLHNNRHTRRIIAMAGGPGAPLQLYANGERLPPERAMLAQAGNPLVGLEGLELRPQKEWDTSVPEEDEGPPQASAE